MIKQNMNTSGIFFNQSFDKKRLKALIEWVFKTFGEKEALRIVEDLKEIGFKNATRAGLSLGLHELTTPPDKAFLVSNAQITMNTTHHDFIGARITATERSQRIVDTWHRVSETLRKQVVDYFSTYDKLNPIYIMALSGARGNFSQVRQLVGMRGLMADPQGKIISFPIRSNLREGLTLTEYFISCSGARKGLVDTALRTADTGYLTRRLVDVSHHIVVKRVACDTHKGILIKKLQSNNKTLLPLKDRLIGRVLAEHIHFVNQKETLTLKNAKADGSTINKKSTKLLSQPLNPSSFKQSDLEVENLLAQKDQEIFPDLALRISNVRQQVFIRSPLTCAFNHELCQLCYGWSLSQGNLVPLGEAVGVIAAQSIGEPGTQLTMRTFHTGGVFSGDLLQEIRASHSGKVYYSQAVQGLLIRTTHGKIAFLTKTPGEIIVIADSNSSTTKHDFGVSTKSGLLNGSSASPSQGTEFRQKTHFPFQSLSVLFARQGEHVEKNQLLAEVSDFGDEGNQSIKSQQTIFAELSGRVIEIQGGSSQTNDLDREEEENEENETLHQIEPEKSGKLGLFHILSTGIGATFNPRRTVEQTTLSQYVSQRNRSKQQKNFSWSQKAVSSNGLFRGILLQKNQKWGIPVNRYRLGRYQQLLHNSRSQLSFEDDIRQYPLLVSKKLISKRSLGQNSNLQNYGRVLPPFLSSTLSPIPGLQGAGVFPFFSTSTPQLATYTSLRTKQVEGNLRIYGQNKHGSSNINGAGFSELSSLLREKAALAAAKQVLTSNKQQREKTSININTPDLLSPQNSSNCLFYLRTIAEEGDLVNEDYKNALYP